MADEKNVSLGNRLFVGMIIGGVAGFIGMIANVELDIDFGIEMWIILGPILSPGCGIILAFLAHFLLNLIDKYRRVAVPIRLCVIAVLGFLAGFLPFDYFMIT